MKPPYELNPAVCQSGNIYADLASFYDQFCAEVDYVEQCAFAERAFALFSDNVQKDYLDLACGTGQHLQQMIERHFLSSGLDNSVAMLAQAAERCPSAHLQLCDLAAFEQVEAFDLVTCFLYSIHYSHPTSALIETVRRAWRALKPGGIFIFNAVDARGIRNDSGITTQLADADAQLSFQSRWHYRGEGDVLDLRLAINRETSSGNEQWSDHHIMTAVTFPQLLGLLESAGFEVTMLEHDYSVMNKWDGESFNAIFIACKSDLLPSA
ncbi:MAG: class I SAM-dependent methyltransferase [Pseudomonadota bacterium]